MDQYEAPLMRYAARLTGCVETARDVVQETFLKLCAQDARKLDGKIPQWLYTVCRNHAFDLKRRNSRMKFVDGTDINEREAVGPSPVEAAEASDRNRTLLNAVHALPERQQEIIQLRFQAGLSYKQIADTLDLTVTNVGFLIHTAIRTIRQSLDAATPTTANAASNKTRSQS
jgi:RNA polymerase sigma-70 factor (ECF subfamily)